MPTAGWRDAALVLGLAGLAILASVFLVWSAQPRSITTAGKPSTVYVTIPKGAAMDVSKPGYVPDVVTVVIGLNNTATWINEDDAPHTVTDKNKAFDSGNMNAGDRFTYTFTSPGTYEYICVWHYWMKGKVIVLGTGQGISTTPPSTQAQQPTLPNVAKNPLDIPPPINRTEPRTVKVVLVAKEVNASLADGVTFTFWTFNGTVPGPLIRVMVGDTVELTLINDASNKMGHNIDLHAVAGPGGGAVLTNVMPGESKTIRFKALYEGAFIYHCAFSPPYLHIAHGMYGVILVEPPGGLPKVDKELYVVQGEWYTVGAFGQKGYQDFSPEKAMAERPEYITFNGHVDALTKLYNVTLKAGDRVRVIFGVGGPNIGSNFHIIGTVFDRVCTGSFATCIANEETWYVPPGSAAVIELRILVPGRYTLVDHALWRIAKGALGFITASGAPNPDIFSQG
jgi:nitrite reductase (NO-forming)